MKFFAIAGLIAVAAAQYGYPAEEASSSQVTLTVTSTLKHTPSAPAAQVPTGLAPYPSKLVETPIGGTAYPTATAAHAKPSDAKPSGTGAYSAPPSQFTGAASSLKAGGVVAAGAIAALFL